MPFTVLAFVLITPFHGLAWLLQREGTRRPGATGPVALVWIASLIATLVLTGAVSYGVFEHLRGARPGLGAILRIGLARAVPVLGASILAGLATGAAACLLIVPGLIVACILFVVVPVVVIERCGAIDALRRSSAVTDGNRWAVLALLILNVLFTTLPALVLGFAWALLGAGAGASPSSPAAEAVIDLLTVPLQPVDGIVRVVCYHDLRVGREGAAVEDLVKVFD